MKTFEEYYKEVREKIIDHWMKDGHSVRNMENDPVVNLLLSALSYQAYHIHNYIDKYEDKTIRELRDRSLPFYLVKPVPAFAMINAAVKEGCGEKFMDETCSFDFQNIKKQKITFTPLMNTKVIKAELNMAFQLAENVWRVNLNTGGNISNLSGLSFYVDTEKNVKIESIKSRGEELPLIKPEQYYQLPFTKWFNNSHLMLNQNYYLFGSYDFWQEIFLTQNLKLYYIGKYNKRIVQENDKCIELDVTFNMPVTANNILKINCIPVVNVEKKEIYVDERNPVKNLAGDTGEFLNLLCDKDNMNEYENIIVRQFGVERYNSRQLFEQIQELLYRYYTDYYAFQDIRELKSTDILSNLQSVMEDFQAVAGKMEDKNFNDNYYAILKKNKNEAKKVEVKFLITSGATANGIRKDEKALKVPITLDNAKTTLLLETKGGRDAVKNESHKEDLAKYYYHTKDRLVTTADIILFINTFYTDNGKLGDEIDSISILNENNTINITINLKNDSYLIKTDKTESLSEILQNKIALRSSGILPFRVMIS